MSTWQRLTDDLFVFPDTCHVYALVDGRRALLIDLGSGACLNQLEPLGVDQVEEVWFTHAHRDQCQGARLAGDLPRRFPAAAREFVDADLRSDFHRVAPGHLAYPHRFHPPQPIPGARFELQPAQYLPWGPYDIWVFAAPGHIDHQLAFRVDGPSGSYLFCGDALAGRGKVHEAFCLETDHYTGKGARLGAETLCALRNLRCEWLCPSHGEWLNEGVWDAFCVTIDKLRELADLKDTIMPRRPAVQRLARPLPGIFHQLTEHLWMWQNSYFLVSDDGPILMCDVPTVLPPEWHEQYHATFGDRPIEVVVVTHLHCDHVMGTEDLRQHHDLQCWAHENLVEAIESPYTFARPWLHGHPTKVDQPLAEGHTYPWHEYQLTSYWFPGQTDLHAVYEVTIDGHHCLLAGDNFYPAQQWGGTGGLCGYNGGRPALWRYSAELVLRLRPDWMLSSHLQPYVYREPDFAAVVEWSDRISGLMRELAPDGNLERHHSPHFIEPRPYVQPAAESVVVALRVRNTYPDQLVLRLTACPPDGVSCAQPSATLQLAPGESAETAWRFHCDPGLEGMRMVTFDVTANGQRWGELCECYVRGDGHYEGI